MFLCQRRQIVHILGCRYHCGDLKNILVEYISITITQTREGTTTLEMQGWSTYKISSLTSSYAKCKHW